MIRIQIWHAASSLTQAGAVERFCESCLDPDERERADQFRQPTSRNQHVIGRGMAKRLLAQQSGTPPSTIRFDLEPHGKPFVCEPPKAVRPFNVAHTHGLVICGVMEPQNHVPLTEGSIKLGVDVEDLNRRTDPAIAERFFSQPEVRFLKSQQDDAARRVAFLRIWTLKESFIKAIGTGMSTPLADFAFEQIESDRPRIRMLNQELDRGEQWQFQVFEPRPGYIAAAAVSSGTETPTLNVDLQSFEPRVKDADH